jgi:hypothetical protein
VHQHPDVKLLIASERHRARLAAAERARLVRDTVSEDDAPGGRLLLAVLELVGRLRPARPRPSESAA